MKKIFVKKVVSGFLVAGLMSSSIAFATDSVAKSELGAFQDVKTSAVSADSAAKSELSAFQDVKTSAVSTGEMNKVSGDAIFIPVLLGVAGLGIYGKIANKVQCGTWSICKAR